MTYEDKLYKKEIIKRLSKDGKSEKALESKTIAELESMMTEYDNERMFDPTLHN